MLTVALHTVSEPHHHTQGKEASQRPRPHPPTDHLCPGHLSGLSTLSVALEAVSELDHRTEQQEARLR